LIAQDEQKEWIELNFHLSKSASSELFDQIATSGVSELLKNPMLLTMIAQFFHSVQQNRVKFEIYRHITNERVGQSIADRTRNEEVEEVNLLLARAATLVFRIGEFRVFFRTMRSAKSTEPDS